MGINIDIEKLKAQIEEAKRESKRLNKLLVKAETEESKRLDKSPQRLKFYAYAEELIGKCFIEKYGDTVLYGRITSLEYSKPQDGELKSCTFTVDAYFLSCRKFGTVKYYNVTHDKKKFYTISEDCCDLEWKYELKIISEEDYAAAVNEIKNHVSNFNKIYKENIEK